MGIQKHTGRYSPHSQSGATLAVVMILVSACMLLAVSALRSATTEAQLSGTLIAAHEAFWLAELGVASGISFARARPAELPDSSAKELTTHIRHGRALPKRLFCQTVPTITAHHLRRQTRFVVTTRFTQRGLPLAVRSAHMCRVSMSAAKIAPRLTATFRNTRL